MIQVTKRRTEFITYEIDTSSFPCSSIEEIFNTYDTETLDNLIIERDVVEDKITHCVNIGE